MRSFITYLKDYLRHQSRISLLLTILLVAILIALNYGTGIETRIRALYPWPVAWSCFFFFYAAVYFLVWGIQFSFPAKRQDISGVITRTGDPLSRDPGSLSIPTLSAPNKRIFLFFLLLAPAYFASKMIHWDLSGLIPSSWIYPWDLYTQITGQLPAKLLLLLIMLFICLKLESRQPEPGLDAGSLQPAYHKGFYGLTIRNFKAAPYFIILLMLVPLIALASTQHDFLHTYPKVKSIGFISAYTKPIWPWKLLYELSYGLDFVSIELFFRGFLVIGLARYGGQQVILPMAAFYCTIHFGKPMGECISSFFGGLGLGIIAWRTRSIFGGLIIHLGLAWMMEAGGWLGNLLH